MGTLLSVIDQEKNKYIERVRVHEGITLCPDDISFNAVRRTFAKLCLNNIWEKFAQTPDITIKEFITEPEDFTICSLTTGLRCLMFTM